jgi:hypothetical protein
VAPSIEGQIRHNRLLRIGGAEQRDQTLLHPEEALICGLEPCGTSVIKRWTIVLKVV